MTIWEKLHSKEGQVRGFLSVEIPAYPFLDLEI
jgi:hypothetical protein